MDAQSIARIAAASASLIGAYMIGRSMGDHREPPRLGRDPADRKRWAVLPVLARGAPGGAYMLAVSRRDRV